MPGATCRRRSTFWAEPMRSDGVIGDMPFRDVFDMEAPPQIDLPDGPVAVSLCHDEMLRLPGFLRHHRGAGIRHFIVVDNASTDGSGEYLDAQTDVTRLFTAKPYQKLKPIFRTWPCDHYLDGRWVTEPDIDEHLVYPGWPEVPLPRLVAHWDHAGHEAVFAPMVDMYADRPLAEVLHGPDDRLLDAYPLFDAEGYWVAPPKRRSRRSSPTPPYILFGGARVRVGRHDRSTLRQRLQRLATRHAMDYRDPRHPLPGARLLHRTLMMHKGMVAGMKSKIALVKWRRGYRFPGSNHMVGAELRLAPDWAALLHFRMMTDYAERERAWAERKAQAPRDEAELAQRYVIDMRWEGSRRLDTWRDLLDAGLLRLSPDLARGIGLDPDQARPQERS